jgi:hypothetical protein
LNCTPGSECCNSGGGKNAKQSSTVGGGKILAKNFSDLAAAKVRKNKLSNQTKGAAQV